MCDGRVQRAGLTLVLLLFCLGRAPAAYYDSGSVSEQLTKQRESLAARIERLTGADEKTAAANDAARRPATEDALTVLRSIDALYAQHQTRLAERNRLDSQIKEAQRELEALDEYKPSEPKPYSFLLLESLADQLELEEARERAIDNDVRSTKQLLKASHEELDAGQRRTRQSAEHAKSADHADAELKQLNATHSRATIDLKQAEIEVADLRSKLCQLRQQQLEKKIKVVKKDVKFSSADRDEQLKRLAGQELQLNRARGQIERDFQPADTEDTSTPTGQAGATKDQRARAAEIHQAELVLIDQQLVNLRNLREVWKRRYTLANDSQLTASKIEEWRDDAADFRDELRDTIASLEVRGDALRSDALRPDAPQKVDPPAAIDDPSKSPPDELRRTEFRDLTDRILADLRATDRMLGRYRAELKERQAAAPTDWPGRLGRGVGSVLGFKVASTDNNESVTIGKLLILLACVVAGTLVAYVLSRILTRRLLPHLGVTRGAAAAVKTIVFYALCVFFGVVAFKLLQIPLAAFAFLGGAAAIAIGFGSQDIMNNAMSGIILLTEQPIRADDIIEIGGVQGRVLHIGLRSTRLRTDSNHELIVPNKTLLDEQVTNLTLSDNFVLKSVSIVLDRNLDVAQTKREMLKIAFSHPLVLKSPQPVVLLKEVDSYYATLTFEIYFSLQLSSFMKCAVVQSEILEAVNETFKTPQTTLPDATPGGDTNTNGDPAGATVPAAAPSLAGHDAAILAAVKKVGRAALARELGRG